MQQIHIRWRLLSPGAKKPSNTIGQLHALVAWVWMFWRNVSCTHTYQNRIPCYPAHNLATTNIDYATLITPPPPKKKGTSENVYRIYTFISNSDECWKEDWFSATTDPALRIMIKWNSVQLSCHWQLFHHLAALTLNIFPPICRICGLQFLTETHVILEKHAIG